MLILWGCADTDFKPPQEVVDAIVARATIGNLAYGYEPEDFAKSITNWYKKRHNIELKTRWITFSPGLILALKMFIESMTQLGDNIIIQSPVYHNFFEIINRNGRNVVKNKLINTNGVYTVDFDDLEKKASDTRTKMLILCSPHNPVSKIFSFKELERISEICIKNNVFVVSDECHSDILFNKVTHIPYSTINEATLNFSATINAGGKTFNTNGLYVAYAIIPNEDIFNKFKMSYARHHFDFSMLGGNAHIAAYEYGEQYVDELNEYLWGNVKFLEGFISNNMPEVIMSPVEATFLVWLDFRKWSISSDEIDVLFKKCM